jgi:hypothetical protein
MNNKLMKSLALTTTAVALLAAIAVPGYSASAAPEPTIWQKTTKTITITQDQINSSYRVTNPLDRAISNVSVTVQQGQISIAATFTKRGQPPINTVSIWQPVIRYGLLDWKFVSATGNGQPITPDLLAIVVRIHHVALFNAVRGLLRSLAPVRITITNVSLTPGLVTITGNVYVWTKTTPTPTTSSTAS